MSQTKAELIEPQGNVAFDTNTLYVDAGNNRVGIGTTSPQAIFHSSAATNTRNNAYIQGSEYGIRLGNKASVGASIDGVDNTTGVASYQPLFVNGSTLILGTGDTERARIDSSGRLLVGTSSGSAQVHIGSAIDSLFMDRNETTVGGSNAAFRKARGSTGSPSIVSDGDVVGTLSWRAYDGSTYVSNAFIRGEVDGTPGTNDMPGRLVFSTTADGASSPTERMRIHENGGLSIGTTSKGASVTDSLGIQLGTSGVVGFGQFIRDGGALLQLNRRTNDGDLVIFYQDNAQEGSISVSGTTVSYNGAHLSRWSQLPSGAERTEILRGTVLSNIDEMCEWGDEDNEQLNRMKISDVEGDKNVSGVFQGWDDDDDTYTNDFYCAMTGDFIIRIGAGVTVERGDLLMSAGDGTAKPQDDDIIRSKTIAKVTSTNVSCTYDDGSYCVPCVLMAC